MAIDNLAFLHFFVFVHNHHVADPVATTHHLFTFTNHLHETLSLGPVGVGGGIPGDTGGI